MATEMIERTGTTAAAMVTRRRFTVEEYRRMEEAGILHEDDRTELIEGDIVQMSAMGSRHAACVGRTDRLIQRRVGDHAIVFVRCPIQLSGHLEPEPDIAVLRPRTDFYDAELPGPTDVLFVVEVADSSLAYDRETKLPLYARAGIPEAFIADLVHDRLERHTEPAGALYRATLRAVRGEAIPSTTVPGLVLAVEEVLGPNPAEVAEEQGA